MNTNNNEDITPIVYQPENKHSCGPNDYGRWLAHNDDCLGTIRHCLVCNTFWEVIQDRTEGFNYVTYGSVWKQVGWWKSRKLRKTVTKDKTNSNAN